MVWFLYFCCILFLLTVWFFLKWILQEWMKMVESTKIIPNYMFLAWHTAHRTYWQSRKGHILSGFPCEGGTLPKNSFLGAIMLRQNIADPHHGTIQTQLWANHQELWGTPRWFLFTNLSIYTPAKNYLPRPLKLRWTNCKRHERKSEL